MKRYSIMILISIFLVLSSIGQERDSMLQIGLPIISQVNQGNSYITFPTDIGNIEPLWFEGNIILNFYLRESKNSRCMGVLTPQVIIRMYQERSSPVRTPSYMPQITLYYHPKFLEDIGLFVQFYHGLDYYNMYFSHRLDVLRFGLMTEKLRF